MTTPRLSFVPESALGATLVSALDEAEARRIVGRLLGTAPVGTLPPSEGGEADSLDLGLRLGTLLLDRAHAGIRGTLLIEIDPAANVQEVALMMEHVLFGTDPPPCPVGICELLSIVRHDDVRELLFQEGSVPSRDLALAETLALQLEYATVIALTGTGSIAPPLIAETSALIRQLNPTAVLLAPDSHEADILHTRPVRGPVAEPLTQTRGWILRLDPAMRLPQRTGPIGSVVFSDPRPFHPDRLAEFVVSGCDVDLVGLILRSRGVVRLASRVHVVGSWASAGGGLELEPTAIPTWDLATPPGQAIAFFGRDLDETALCAGLSECLLTMPELLGGPELWNTFEDPFPIWSGPR